MIARKTTLSLFLFTIVLFLLNLSGDTDSPPIAHAEAPPPPLPAECGGATGPGGACCLFGYIYHDDAPVESVNVYIESPPDLPKPSLLAALPAASLTTASISARFHCR